MILPVDVIFAIIKILVMIGFFLSMAALATWADRRQGAMVQDRVGPNRAVIYLPSSVVRVLVLLPPTILGAFAVLPAIPPFPFFANPAYQNLRLPQAFEVLTITTQAAILVAWFSLLVLTGVARRSGPINDIERFFARFDPRAMFYGGVVAHAIGFAITSAIPADLVVQAARGTSVLLGSTLFLAGIYTSSRVPDGPIPVRLAGTLHTIADSIKMIWKEDFVPKNADRLLHSLAPMLAIFPALVTFAVIPFGDKLCFARDGSTLLGLGRAAPAMGRVFSCPGGHAVSLQIADLNVGILYLFAMAGTGVVGAAIAGWASDNKFSLLGGLRAASQMVSYEVAMGLSLVGLFLIYGAVRFGPMVDWQGENAWGIFVQPFGFLLFLTALTAETKRIPFDQPEGESEIVAGYIVEYSGMKWGMFYTGEYLELITSSALLVTMFFGGYHLPFLHGDGLTVAFGETTLVAYKMNHVAVVLISALTFFGKTILMTWLQIFFRWTLPRFRYDQVMKLGWTKLLPLALANMMVTGVIVLAIDTAGPGVQAGLRFAADVTQGLVALGFVAGFVALVVGLLEPTDRKSIINSTATRFAQAAGGTRAEPRQA